VKRDVGREVKRDVERYDKRDTEGLEMLIMPSLKGIESRQFEQVPTFWKTIT
jgi:hypothetical protein